MNSACPDASLSQAIMLCAVTAAKNLYFSPFEGIFKFLLEFLIVRESKTLLSD
jgi:hypothetical protein